MAHLHRRCAKAAAAKLISSSNKPDPLAKLMDLIGANRHVPLSLSTLLLSLASPYRIAFLSGFAITDGCIASNGSNRKTGYRMTQGLLMSILGKYRYQSHLSIMELAADISVFEGLGGQMWWNNHHGYGEVAVGCSGLLLDRLCEAIGKIMPRKGFEQSYLRSPGLANCVRIEEVPVAQVPSGEKEVVCVPMTAAGPAKLVFSNWTCANLDAEAENNNSERLTELLGWGEHVPDGWQRSGGRIGGGSGPLAGTPMDIVGPFAGASSLAATVNQMNSITRNPGTGGASGSGVAANRSASGAGPSAAPMPVPAANPTAP